MPAYKSEHYSPESRRLVLRLEKKYAHRGLLFTTPIMGSVPVQGYGHVDGQRFYFRFRGNWGNLRVGPYDRELEELHALRVNEDKATRKKARMEKALAEGNPIENAFDWLDEREEKVVEEDCPDFMPTIITAAAFQEGADPEDIYNGFLDDIEAFTMFSYLLDNLEPVPVENQIPESTRVWLYEGRAAANAYWSKLESQHQSSSSSSSSTT